nr:glycoprotein precursor [Yezo virus]
MLIMQCRDFLALWLLASVCLSESGDGSLNTTVKGEAPSPTTPAASAVAPTNKTLPEKTTTVAPGNTTRVATRPTSSPALSRWLAGLYSRNYEDFHRRVATGMVRSADGSARMESNILGYSGNLSKGEQLTTTLIRAVDPRIADVFQVKRTVLAVKDRVAGYSATAAYNYLGKMVYNVDEDGVVTVTGLSDLGNSGYTLHLKTQGPHVPADYLRPGCEKLHNCCEGPEKQVDIFSLRSENIKVSSEPGSKYLSLAYLTGYLGFDARGCKAVVENHGSMYLLTENSVEQVNTVNNGKVYPIIHIFIDRTDPGENCAISMCNLIPIPGATGGLPVRQTKKQLIKVSLGGPEHSAFSRKLLSLRTQHNHAHQTPCNQPSHIMEIDQYKLHAPESSFAHSKSSVCNGTLISNKDLSGVRGCYVVARATVMHNCKQADMEPFESRGKCLVDNKLVSCEASESCIRVKVNDTTFIKVKSNDYHNIIKCTKECLVPAPKGSLVLVTCPDGEDIVLHTNKVDLDCPLLSYLGKPAIYVCRATYRPRVFYALIIWVVFGYSIGRIAFILTFLLLWIFNRLTRTIIFRMDKQKDTCSGCGEFVDHTVKWARHDSCNSGSCPYCNKLSSLSKLKEHAKTCTSKVKELEQDEKVLDIALVPKWSRRLESTIKAFSKTLSRIQWVVVSCLLMYFLFHPVSGLSSNLKGKDFWDKSITELEVCQPVCVYEEEYCTCPIQESPTLHNHSIHHIVKRSLLSLPVAGAPRDLDIEASWGTVHIENSYQPSVGGNHISLSWQSQNRVGSKVVVAGKSEAILRLDPRSGLKWSITSPDSSESRNIFVSILEYAQEYETQFEYLTSNRKLGTWMHGVCTGTCPEKCGCKSHTCSSQKWENTRNWRCNPTWCWNIGGCTCCGADIDKPFQDWILTKWSTDYARTTVIACVEFEHGSRQCDLIDAGTTISLGGISVSFSGVTGITTMLPRQIALVHKAPGNHKDFDLVKPIGMIDGTDLCKLQACTHGPAGDFQIYNLNGLVDNDVTNMNFWKTKTEAIKKDWMSWQGTVLQYYCNPGDWPTCVMSGAVNDNSGAFENLWKRSTKLHQQYFFHSEKIDIRDGSPTLTLKGRPYMGGGQITALLSVSGLELESKTVLPKGVKLHITMCEGCYGCATGITCSVSITLDSPDRYGLHLSSNTEGVIASETTLTCSAGQVNDFKLRLFSSLPEDKICLRVREAPKESEDASSCLSVKLQPPEEVVLEHRSVLTSTGNSTCGKGFLSCLGSNIAHFFGSIGTFLKDFFGSIWKGLVVIIPIVIILILLILFGPNLLSLIKVCISGRKSTIDRKVYYESGKRELERYRQIIKEEEELLRRNDKKK